MANDDLKAMMHQIRLKLARAALWKAEDLGRIVRKERDAGRANGRAQRFVKELRLLKALLLAEQTRLQAVIAAEERPRCRGRGRRRRAPG